MLTTDQILAMTDDEVCVEMVRLDGWTVTDSMKKTKSGSTIFEITQPFRDKYLLGENFIGTVHYLPNFNRNITLIFDFETRHIITEADRYDYGKALNNLIKSKHRMISTSEYMYFLASATPDERCRAYLIMVNVMRGEKATE